MALKARKHGCEEASLLTQRYYIPCNKPAVRRVFHARDNRLYRMCEMCADHNISNRGGQDMGEYIPGSRLNPS